MHIVIDPRKPLWAQVQKYLRDGIAAGHARRERDRDDRRKVVVSLVEARLTRDLAPHYERQAEQLGQAIAQFTPGELHTIGSFLHALAGPHCASSDDR